VLSAQTVQQVLEVEPLVDTGFDGGVCLPADAIDPALVPSRHLVWGLADGSEVVAPAFTGSVQIGELPPVRTVIIFLGDSSLLGRHVTDHFSVTFDHGQRVIVEL
jgi:predicted aspartyl protease